MPTLLTSNAITAIQLKKSSAPGTPASGYGRLWVHSDGALKYVNDAGSTLNISADLPRLASANTFTDTTNTTSVSTGALNTAGGLGVAKSAIFGGTSAGIMALGGTLYNHVMLSIGLGGNPLTQTHQVGGYAALSGNSSATGAGSFVGGFETALGIDAGSIVLERAAAFNIGLFTAGAGSSVARTYGFAGAEETAGTTGNATFCIFDAAVTGNWFIYYDGTRKSRLSGGDLIGPSEIYRANATSYTRVSGGDAAGSGASISLFGQTHATRASTIDLVTAGSTRWTVDATGTLIGAANLNLTVLGTGQISVAATASATGTAVVHNANGFYYDLSSSRRFKEHFAPFEMTTEQEADFLALRPEWWDYTGSKDGAVSLMAEDLDGLASIRHAEYDRSPFVNYDEQGRPKSNRDYALLAALHQIVARQAARIDALEHRLAAGA